MQKISKEVLKKCANNLMFDMLEEEYDTLLNEFDDLINQMTLMDKIEGLKDLEPMTFPFECSTSFLRDDEEGEMLDIEEVLSNAKDVSMGQIKLPKVVK